MGSIVGRDVRVPHAAAVDTQSCEANSRLCATLLVGKKPSAALISREPCGIRHRVFPWP